MISFSIASVDFIRVNFAHEHLRADVTERSTHDAQARREECHVTEIEDRLKHAVHSEDDQGSFSFFSRSFLTWF